MVCLLALQFDIHINADIEIVLLEAWQSYHNCLLLSPIYPFIPPVPNHGIKTMDIWLLIHLPTVYQSYKFID